MRGGQQGSRPVFPDRRTRQRRLTVEPYPLAPGEPVRHLVHVLTRTPGRKRAWRWRQSGAEVVTRDATGTRCSCADARPCAHMLEVYPEVV